MIEKPILTPKTVRARMREIKQQEDDDARIYREILRNHQRSREEVRARCPHFWVKTKRDPGHGGWMDVCQNCGAIKK